MLKMSKDTMVLIQILTLMFQIIVVPVFSGVTYITLNVLCAIIIISICYFVLRRRE